MGAGKTTYAIAYISGASPLERFIYVTHFLAEVDRVISLVTGRHRSNAHSFCNG